MEDSILTLGERDTPHGARRYVHAAAADSHLPTVSVVIPCYNEERFICKVLENLLDQYEHDKFEIIVVDGNSSDATRDRIAEFAARHSEVPLRVVANPKRNIPTALNLGVAAAQGEIIVRMDAHSVPSANYVRRCAEAITGDEAAVVGMVWRIEAGAETEVARAIACAVAHPFGIGDAKYRTGIKESQFVDTVPFGAFRKSLWQQVGGFDEELLANEDYDFYYRIRQRGGRILLDASGYSRYFARPTLGDLAAQYARYGGWKVQMLKRYPRSVRLRQIVAPTFVLSIITTGLISLWWHPALWLLVLILAAYASLAFICALRATKGKGGLGLAMLTTVSFLVIHIAWGSSFLLGLVRAPAKPTVKLTDGGAEPGL